MQRQKWDIQLNEFGSPMTGAGDLQRLMIMESWERGDLDTKHLENEYRRIRRKMFSYGSHLQRNTPR